MTFVGMKANGGTVQFVGQRERNVCFGSGKYFPDSLSYVRSPSSGVGLDSSSSESLLLVTDFCQERCRNPGYVPNEIARKLK